MNKIEIGKIVNIHGVHGEIKVLPYADSAAFFKNFKKIYIGGAAYAVLSVKTAKGCAVLKLEGLDNPLEAEKLREKTVTVQEADLPAPKEGTYYVKDLEGMEVYAHGEEGEAELLGILKEVIFTGANDVYSVINERGKEYLIPAVKHFIIKTDVKNKRMDITHIRGITYDED